MENIDRNQGNNYVLLNEAMASCQSVTQVNEELIGDPLEIKMLEDTDWELDESHIAANSQIGGDDVVLAYVRPKCLVGAKAAAGSRRASSGSESSNYDSYESSSEDEPEYSLAIIKRFDFESKI